MIYTFAVSREFRLRMRIDELQDKLARAEAQLEEERSQVVYLTRRVRVLREQREQWRERAARRAHELDLAYQRRARKSTPAQREEVLPRA